MGQRLSNGAATRRKPHLWLASVEGTRLPHPLEDVAPAGSPEAPIAVEFVGLTEEQQLAALAAFPGGRRFVLVPKN